MSVFRLCSMNLGDSGETAHIYDESTLEILGLAGVLQRWEQVSKIEQLYPNAFPKLECSQKNLEQCCCEDASKIYARSRRRY